MLSIILLVYNHNRLGNIWTNIAEYNTGSSIAISVQAPIKNRFQIVLVEGVGLLRDRRAGGRAPQVTAFGQIAEAGFVRAVDAGQQRAVVCWWAVHERPPSGGELVHAHGDALLGVVVVSWVEVRGRARGRARRGGGRGHDRSCDPPGHHADVVRLPFGPAMVAGDVGRVGAVEPDGAGEHGQPAHQVHPRPPLIERLDHVDDVVRLPQAGEVARAVALDVELGARADGDEVEELAGALELVERVVHVPDEHQALGEARELADRVRGLGPVLLLAALDDVGHDGDGDRAALLSGVGPSEERLAIDLTLARAPVRERAVVEHQEPVRVLALDALVELLGGGVRHAERGCPELVEQADRRDRRAVNDRGHCAISLRGARCQAYRREGS